MSGDVVSELYAWVTIDPADGNEGVMAFRTASGDWMPMIGADMARIESLRPMVMAIISVTGHKGRVELRRFGTMTVVERFDPDA